MQKLLAHELVVVGGFSLIDLCVLGFGNFKTVVDAEYFSFVINILCLIVLGVINVKSVKRLRIKSKQMFFSFLLTGVVYVIWFLSIITLHEKYFYPRF